MFSTVCLECKANITIDIEPYIGQRLTCAACSTLLEVVWLFPLSLAYLEDEFMNPPSHANLGGEFNPIGN